MVNHLERTILSMHNNMVQLQGQVEDLETDLEVSRDESKKLIKATSKLKEKHAFRLTAEVCL